MTNKATLLFLHGVGDGDPTNKWEAQLAESLSEACYPALENVELIVPKFAHALKGADESSTIPPRTHKRPNKSEATQIRRNFEQRMAAMEFKLGRHDEGKGRIGDNLVIRAALEHLPQMAQASHYLKNETIRAQVLNRILSKLPSSGRLVILAHSLGSVIAADLLLRLPEGISVEGFVTIGSPLGHRSFNIDGVWDHLKEPPAHLAWWVNFWNENDPVTAYRGLSSRFAWMTDYKVDSFTLLNAHAAVDYLRRPIVAEAVGYGLYGSKSKELVPKSSALEATLSDTEQMALFALRYAHLINMRLEKDQKTRYSGALRQVQANIIDGIIRWNNSEGRTTPHSISRLAFDLADPNSVAPVPSPCNHLPIDQAVVSLSALVSENIIRPFEISVKIDVRQEALEDLSAEMGLTSKFGTDVFIAAEKAQDLLSSRPGSLLKWKKWGALGLGAAALVAATGGLALAAAPGLAGAALLSSALASFGPGGMIGGLITAGSLASAGGGGIAFGLANSSTSAADLEAVVERMLATEILRVLQGLPSDPAVRRTLVETEIQVRREYERLDEFSDRNAPGLGEIKSKLTSIERALNYVIENCDESDAGIED